MRFGTARWPWGAATLLVASLLACRPTREARREVAGPPVVPPPPPLAPSAPPPPLSASGLLLAGPDTFGVMIGVLRFADPGVMPFSPDRRKDAELHALLAARGVPPGNVALLLDEQASLTAVYQAVESAARRAGPRSTFFFYYAGHGARDEHGTHFVAYDTQGSTDGFRIAELSKLLIRDFRGQRLVLMGDCCYSGALAEVAREVRAARPVEVLVLTSAEASNLSTSSWIFTQTVLDALAGEPLHDHDGDGRISVAELGVEVGDAMKYREGQRHGYAAAGLSEAAEVARARAAVDRAPVGALKVGDYVKASHERGPLPARVVALGERESQVRFYLYNHAEDRRLATASLVPIAFRRYPIGSKLRVHWGGKLWDAEVVRAEGDFHFVTYPGSPSYWDEWVTSTRIDDPAVDRAAPPPTLQVGASVEVEWQGSWYAATIVQRGSGRYYVHYTSYDASWDEWVPPHRIRSPR